MRSRAAAEGHPPLGPHQRDPTNGEVGPLDRTSWQADVRSKKRGKHSTWGVGKTGPDPAGAKQLGDGQIAVPMGAAGPSEYLKEHLERIKAEGGGNKAELLYNEFIVYDTKQVRAKYVVVVDFDFDV